MGVKSAFSEAFFGEFRAAGGYRGLLLKCQADFLVFRSAVFDGAWLEPGQHVVTVVGSNSALVTGGWVKQGRRENDDETVRRADIIATNWRESIESEKQAGIYDPLQAGIISWDKIHELGAIASGQAPGRTSAEQITYHANNNGTAAADLAIAQWVFKTCKQMGRGIPLSLPRPGQQ